MSSAEEDSTRDGKKRKIQRPCDSCRRKKIKCDGPSMPGNRCSRCTAKGAECVYTESSIKRSYPSSYVEGLENRLERMERLVNKLCPEEEPPEFSLTHSEKESASLRNIPPETSRHASASPTLDGLSVATSQIPGSSKGTRTLYDDDPQPIVDGMHNLRMDSQVHRYHGMSTGLAFLHSTMEMEQQYAQAQEEQPERRKPWLQPATALTEGFPLFTDYPPNDLLESLVDLYFRKVNDMAPLLHEPTFKKAVADGLHHRHSAFGAIVLLVCANGSRFSRDPRVYIGGSEEWQSAGWRWFEQVERARKVPLAPAQLYDLQLYVLMALFLQGTREPHTSWSLIGTGIRMGIDVGAHRKAMYVTMPTVEGELWRRAFWLLIYSEWVSAYALGRPASIYPEDIDLDLPTEVDDEHWITSEGVPLFHQPADRPSRVSFFVHAILLIKNVTFASRTFYHTLESQAKLRSRNSRWEEEVVAQLDSAINEWSDSLPKHLKWDPDCEDILTLTQSATLHAHCCHAQIAVHRPFMSAARRDSPLSFPSLIICMNAARSAVRVTEKLYRRSGTLHYRNIGTLYIVGVVLTMNIMGQKRAGRPVNMSRDLKDIERCVEMADAMKHDSHACEIICDLLKEMMAAANAPVELHDDAQTDPTSTGKRRRRSSSSYARGRFAEIMPGNASSEAESSELSTFPQASGAASHRMEDPPMVPVDGSLELSHIANSSAADFGDYALAQNPRTPFELSVATPPLPVFSLLGNPEFATSLSEEVNLPPSSEFSLSAEMPMFPSGDGPGLQPEQDLAWMDDTMDMWSDAPHSFGWDDWRAYFGNANDGRSFSVAL